MARFSSYYVFISNTLNINYGGNPIEHQDTIETPLRRVGRVSIHGRVIFEHQRHDANFRHLWFIR